MKRFFIIVALLLGLVVTGLGGFVYFFNINHYSQWISEQIEESSGYQVRFGLIENSGGEQMGFSVTDASVAIDNTELLHVDKVNISIRDLDLWNQNLEVELVELLGVDLFVDLDVLENSTTESKNVTKGDSQSQRLPWSKLYVNKLRIKNLNAEISDQAQYLSMQKGSLISENIMIIEHNKLASRLLSEGNFQVKIKQLNLQQAGIKKLTVRELALNGDFDLSSLQAKLAVASQQLMFRLTDQDEIVAENNVLDMQWDKEKVNLIGGSADIFSGELQVQAEALLTMPILSSATSPVEKLTVLSLSAKNMHIEIPELMQSPANQSQDESEDKLILPVKTLLLEQIDLQNIAISSKEKQLPLTVTGLNLHLQDVYLLENNQLISLFDKAQESGLFSLQFEVLQWEDTVSKQLHLSGSFAEDAQLLQFLNGI